MNKISAATAHETASFDLLILGDGASAGLVALRALQRAAAGTRIGLVGPGTPGRGIAYATDDLSHRLNVPAGKMSALAEVPGDFVDFLKAAGLADDAPGDALAARYVSRAWYGAYLQTRLAGAIAASNATFEHIAQRAVHLAGDAGARVVRLADGTVLAASHVVLALGNALRPLPLAGADALPAAQSIGAWDVPALRAIHRDADVLVVGTGLTLADVVATLRGQGHRGRIHAVSRHGLLPLPHAPAAPWAFDAPALLALSLRERVRALRTEVAAAVAAGQPWQAVFEAIRPLGVRLWTSLSQADQRRFLRHVVRLWDVHRHRIAPEIAGVLAAAQTDDQLRHHRGGVRALSVVSDRRLQLELGDGSWLTVDVIINATGIQTRVAAMDSRLLQALLASGLACPGPHGLGLDVDARGRLRDSQGVEHDDILVIGSLRMGNHWETIAIPELRQQALDIAERVLHGPG